MATTLRDVSVKTGFSTRLIEKVVSGAWPNANTSRGNVAPIIARAVGGYSNFGQIDLERS